MSKAAVPRDWLPLLRRQNHLVKIKTNSTDKQESIPALCLAIAQGCCQRVKKKNLCGYILGYLVPEHEKLITAALEVDGALPALRSLRFGIYLSEAGVIALARALAGGAAPALQHLGIRTSFSEGNEEVWDSVAGMLEARANIPGCARFESFGDDWLDIRSLVRKTRILRALLPSVKDLPFVTWGPEIEACLCEV